VFVREATGLVREISATSLLMFSIINLNWLFIFNYQYSLEPLLGGTFSACISILMLTVIMVPTIVVFWSVGTMMPRSAGDYVFVSRTLSPLLGFVENWLAALAMVLFAGMNCIVFETSALTPFFTYIGVILNNAAWVNFGVAVSTQTWIAGIGTVTLLLSFLPAAFSLKTYLRIQNVCCVLAMAAVVAMIYVFASIPHAGFVSSYNAFVGQYIGKPGDYYSNVTATAQSSGFTPPADSLWGGLLIVPVVAGPAAGWVNAQLQVGGEIRRARSSLLFSMIVSYAALAIVETILLVLMYNVAGYQWMASMGYLLYNNPGAIALSALPYSTFLSMIAATPVLGALIGLATIASLFIFMPNAYIWVSRCLFAYSFDRVLPSWFANVSEKTHGPLNATVTAVIIAGAFFIILEIPQSSTYAYLFASVVTLLIAIFICIVSIAMMLLPKLKPQIYERSPTRGAVLYASSAVTLIGWLIIAYLLLSNSIYGANTPIAIGVVVGLVVILCIIFGVAKLKRGPDFSLAFKELPPE